MVANLKSIVIFFCSVFLFMFGSCQRTRSETILSDEGYTFNQSLNQWNAFKKATGDSYIYKMSFASWTGYRNETTIEVTNGKVISRKFKESKEYQQEMETIYHEKDKEVGSHPAGKQPVTIDELYHQSEQLLNNASTDTHTIYFKTTNDGLLQICGLVPKDCADDCFEGISIDEIRPSRH